MFDKKAKYLEFVQSIINRMADCSFRCKEFCVLICSAMVTVFCALEKHPSIILLLCNLPIILFWFLDSYYLWQERGFRELYNEKAVLNDEKSFDDFTIKPNHKRNRFISALFSKTVFFLYVVLIVLATTFGVVLLII